LIEVSAAHSRGRNRGRPIAAKSFVRIAGFIGVPPETFLCFTGNTNCNTLKQKGDGERDWIEAPGGERRH